MSIVRRGSGRPLTLFAPGGEGDKLVHRMRYADQVAGTKVGFKYGQTGHLEQLELIRCEADRDAVEVCAVANEHQVTRAIGFSRGARAIVGALAEVPDLCERIVLVIPPGRTAAGRYSSWLESLRIREVEVPDAKILVVAHRGDRGHPARVAEAWAEQLDARLELLPSQAVHSDVEAVGNLLADFLR